MEANRVTNPQLLDILNELKQHEPIFHHPEFGTTRADFERMMDPTFCEVGASGRCYSREFVLDELEKRYAIDTEEDDWQTRDFHCLEITANIYLLTYTLVQGARLTRRATVWRRTTHGWKIVYHQGTLVEDQVK